MMTEMGYNGLISYTGFTGLKVSHYYVNTIDIVKYVNVYILLYLCYIFQTKAIVSCRYMSMAESTMTIQVHISKTSLT